MTYPPDYLINGSGKGGKGKGGKGGPPGEGNGGKGGLPGGGNGTPGSGKGGGKGGKGGPPGGALNCWNWCNEMDGPCDWCGNVKLCCRKGWIGNGCDGSIGGTNQHQCVLNPGTNILSCFRAENLQEQKANSTDKRTDVWSRDFII